MSVLLRQVSSIGWHRILVIFLVLWLLVLVLSAFPGLNSTNTFDSRSSERLAKALSDLEALRKQNEELQVIFKEISTNNLSDDQKEAIENFQTRLTKAERPYTKLGLSDVSSKEEPNTQYELLRRRIYANTKEFWFYVHSNLLEIQKKAGDVAPDIVDIINQVLSLGAEHKRSLLHDITKLAEVDGYEDWRQKESQDLSDLVQERFKFLQNPEDCDTARKLVCSLNKGCGYGCQLHHVVYCFMVAYGTKRTLILKSKGWRYHKSGWEDIFMPLSDTCTSPDGETMANWPGHVETQVINLPIIDSLSPRPPYLPLAIPEDLAPRLTRLHGDPVVWWVGQILKYLLRPREKTTNLIEDAINKLGYKRPIVGVHVRRTDKVGTEAAFHGLEEYMTAVDEYYKQLSLSQKIDKKRIYLASDDPKVLLEAKTKYTDYEVICDPQISKTAAVSSRYSDTSLFGIILDIHMLSLSDFLVCTFSSQVCRVAYEVMQNYYPDASSRYKSLDDIYYYGGQNPHNMIAVYPHEPKRQAEMQIAVGDLIGVAGNHWNGFSKGRNLRTNQNGLYPSFKMKDKIEVAKFPVYSELYKNKQKTNKETPPT
ncbi:alpha-(1,6)-fucosyltransferase 8 [Rhynchophorus ferrugineus]|uniref:alpha-(1,6)-fucosyltransferase 8 n=1 Tax=Rhynchophorus ferrugineus TaxID=354439 RepID=UPI003FCC94BB